ncbi:Rgg/GadR/MutR family transcriptional regulator [Streptococcus ovuberis]|uniref:Rgg/GadR/MutR family transcriptional regulator n=1 Tax=Streptococcus ovuberis TaxID=1936207 RepID=A0A7X6N1X3_9STRE|nr:Rgg/GadR/MutR family transcriptional regulator [Streptococcus ovuberis]NKZ20707.1 Rgg/GadR/MutR family transcriptional regulator [Streptococcus ovuberis]
MPNYGSIFREFRRNRQLTLQDVADEMISVAQLSRFECGQTDLSLSRFLHILDKIGLTADEFMDRVNNYQRIEQIGLMAQMAKYHYQRDLAGLAQMVATEETKLTLTPNNRRAKLNRILFLGAIAELDSSQPLVQADLDFVSDHLFCTEQWQISELILIGNLYRFYDTASICRMVDEVVKRKPFYQEISTHRNLVETTLLNVMETLVERGELDDASRYDKVLSPLITNERKAYHRLIYLYVKGFLKQAQGDRTGISDMEHAIQSFSWMGSTHHAKTYQTHFDRWIKKI